METIFDPIVKAASDHSFNTRDAVNAGGQCGCFHCLRTFAANDVTKWFGNSAVCPFCHIDSVLSENVDPIDHDFLLRMQKASFENKVRPLNVAIKSCHNVERQ